MTIYDGVLAGEVGLVEIVCVGDVRAAETGVDGKRGVGANEHGDATGSTSRAGTALLVEGDIASDDNGVTAVPGRRFHPVDRVEQGIGSTIARVHSIHALNVEVARLLEQLHQDRLDRLGLVEQGLGADFHAANRLGVDVVLLEEGSDGGQGERVNVYRSQILLCGQRLWNLTLAVIAEGHFGLAEANSVFALGDAIELLKLGLVDALQRELEYSSG